MCFFIRNYLTKVYKLISRSSIGFFAPILCLIEKFSLILRLNLLFKKLLFDFWNLFVVLKVFMVRIVVQNSSRWSWGASRSHAQMIALIILKFLDRVRFKNY